MKARWKDLNKVEGFLVVVVFVAAFTSGFSVRGLYDTSFDTQVNVSNSFSPNVPQPNVSTDVRVDAAHNNYIQANNHDVGFSSSGTSLTVYGVDNWVTMYGSSMQPTMFTGHTALMREYEGGDLDEGSIVMTESSMVHRIKADYTGPRDFYATQGDNNKGSEVVKPSEITHVVVGVLYTDG